MSTVALQEKHDPSRKLDDLSVNMIEDAKEALRSVDDNLSKCQFKQAIRSAMSLAQETNRYLDGKSPWKVIKENRQAAADSLYVALCVISYLKTMLYPFLPFSSQKLHQLLGLDGNVEEYGWQPTVPQPGPRSLPPQPLFSTLADGVIEEAPCLLGPVS